MFRDGDVFGRIGGDEFAAVLQGVSEKDAIAFAERLRLAIADMRCSMDDASCPAHGVSFTVSIGVRIFDRPTELSTLMHDADAAMYDAKRAGRNCVQFVKPDKPLVFPSRSLRQS